jgi:hypothetical protein
MEDVNGRVLTGWRGVVDVESVRGVRRTWNTYVCGEVGCPWDRRTIVRIVGREERCWDDGAD